MGETEREAVIGELIHDAGSDRMTGWFILGVDGYFDVDNAVWCEFQDGDAPWTSEFFELCGTVPFLTARRESLAERLRQNWKTFRTHRPVGEYLPVGQLDGDCRECGEQWPCSTILAFFGLPSEGWMHVCPEVEAERWYPIGVACALCGRRLSDG